MKLRVVVERQVRRCADCINQAFEYAEQDGFANNQIIRALRDLSATQHHLVKSLHSFHDAEEITLGESTPRPRTMSPDGSSKLVEWPLDEWECPQCGNTDGFGLVGKPKTSEARPGPDSSWVRADLECRCECGFEATVGQAALMRAAGAR